jgi:hypothetical protein
MLAELMVLIVLAATGFATGVRLGSHLNDEPTRARSGPASLDREVADVKGDVCVASKVEGHAPGLSTARDCSSSPAGIPFPSSQAGDNSSMSIIGIRWQRSADSNNLRNSVSKPCGTGSRGGWWTTSRSWCDQTANAPFNVVKRSHNSGGANASHAR